MPNLKLVITSLSACLLLGCQAPSPPLPPEPESVQSLIQILASPTASLGEREAAEQQLLDRPSEELLLKLTPSVARGMPEGAIWNSWGTAKRDDKFPPRWRAFHANRRVWSHHAEKNPKLTAKILLAELEQTESKHNQDVLVRKIEQYWSASAEEPVAAVLRTFGDEESNWFAAASCLLKHKRDKYHDEVKRIAQQLPSENWRQSLRKAETLQMLLVKPPRPSPWEDPGPRGKKPPPLDKELVRLGFELLEIMEPQAENLGYFLAGSLERYVDLDARPSSSDPLYKDASGQLDQNRYFRARIDNAVTWWSENQCSFPPVEAAESDRGESHAKSPGRKEEN